jgi:DNA-binding GntR family transcriptional regulator
MSEPDTARDDSPADERSNVDRIYTQLKSMAAAFVLRPGERVNESVLAKKLKVSRTPLREALNRLTIEGFLEIRTGKGFFRKMLDPKEVFDLFQLRVAIECSGIALVVGAAQDEDIDALEAFLDETGGDQGHRPVLELVQLDERFHETLLGMSGNVEFVRVLRNINSRIRFVRWVDIGRRGRLTTQAEHRAILQAVRDRDGVTASQLLEKHIERRMDEVTSTIREGFSRIYMDEGPIMEAMRDS